MKINKLYCLMVLIALFLFTFISAGSNIIYAKGESTADLSDTNIKKIESYIKKQMKKAKIPGISVVIVKGNEIPYIKGFGYADLEKKKPATPDTLFEVASCSKSYTAAAVLQLRDKGLIGLDDPVSKYFPGFHGTYKNKKYEITIRQLLHHTGGIPDTTISLIPPSDAENALEQVVGNLSGVKLNNAPGKVFEYATINYDVLGAIVQKVTGKLFEDYMQEDVFKPLALNHTTVYPQASDPEMASGYKLSFFTPWKYVSPVYRGNRPAGYVITNAKDTARWLMLQMGTEPSNLLDILKETQIPDRTVEPRWLDRSSYAMGWAQSQIGSGEIAKAGMNPSFSAYMTFRPEDKIGVGVLTNFNSEYTFVMGKGIMEIIFGDKPSSYYRPEEGLSSWDKGTSIIALFSILFLLAALGYIGFIIYECIKGRRRLKGFERGDIKAFIIPLVAAVPFAIALYVFPSSVGYTWPPAIVWLPQSFTVAVAAMIASAVVGYLCYIILYMMPLEDRKKNQIPSLIVLSLLSGIGNYMVISLINSQIYDNKYLGYKIYYFLLAMLVYIFGRKVIETGLIRITNRIIYDKRMDLVKYIFSTSYSEYEKLDSGRVLATLNYDTETVGNSASIIVTFITYFITIVCCFIYMGTISLLGMLLTLGVAITVAVIYSIATQKVNIYWEEARNTQDVYMRFIDSLMKGFKELSLHKRKKKEFKGDVDESCTEYRDKRNIARLKFLTIYLIGESMLILVLATIAFLFPNLFESMSNSNGQQNYNLAKFIITFLYIIGPINGILGAFPQIMQIRVSWNRIRDFIRDIPHKDLTWDADGNDTADAGLAVDSISLREITFEYGSGNENEEGRFSVGPVDLELRKGEIMFITGGNGSGKTTLAKIITGLYAPSRGTILVNGREMEQKNLGELFSTVFSDFYLFDRLYEIDFDNKQNLADRYLKLLELEDKVQIKDGRFTTLKLSAGQRKRLALLICLLEDRPIYLFDEWAADQDPQFRKFFYKNILAEMKARGKIVFAISHDDHYYDVADKIVKMNEGKVDKILENALVF